MSLFVGLDIGTSGGRCLIVDEDGRAVASASRGWRYRHEGLGACQLDPGEAWSALVDATREALAAVHPRDVRSIGVTSQRTGVVFLDDDGRELYSGPNADARGVAEGIALERDHGDRAYRVAGRLPVMLYLPARLAWFRANRPDVAERIRWALSFSDWAIFRLTGVAGTEPTQAAEMLVYDVASGTWSDELCRLFGVPRHLLPEIHDPGAPTGGLTSRAADELGLPPGLPTVAGGSDTQAAAIAVGVGSTGQGAVVAGSTMVCEQPVAEPAIDPERRLWTSPHLLGGFVLETHCGEAGVTIDWMANVLGESPEWIDKSAGASEPGAGGLFFLDAAPGRVGDFPLLRTGALLFPAPLLALERSREDVARATLEGIAFAATAGLEWTNDVGGDVDDVAVTGGVARSRTFTRILATTLRRPIRAASQPNGSSLGAAILASVAAGEHDDIRSAAEAMSDRGENVEPHGAWADLTATAFAGWRERISGMDETTIRVSHMIGPP